MAARVLALGTVLITALLLQTVVAPSFSVAGWAPDLVLLTVVGLSLADGPATGARYGFTAGLAADLLAGGGQLVGLQALVFLLVGDATGRLRPYLSGTARAGELVVGAAAGLCAFGLFGLLSMLLDLRQFTGVLVLQGALARALWTAVLTPLAAPLLAALTRRHPGPEAPAAPARTW